MIDWSAVFVLAALLLVAALMPARAQRPAPPDRGIGDCQQGYFDGGVRFFDTTGPAGVMIPDLNQHHGSWYLVSERGYYLASQPGQRSWGFTYTDPYDAVCTGEAFYYEVETGIEEVGKVSGMWAVDAFYPYGYFPRMIFPIPGEWGGMILKEEASDRPTGMAMHIRAFIADSRMKPSLGAPVESVFDLQDRSLTLTAEYLPGNAAAGVTSETLHRSSAITFQGETWMLALWGDTSGNSNGAHIAKFTGIQPAGPLRITLSIDGLTSDTVTFDARAGRRYYWTGILTPDPTSEWETPSLKDRIPYNYPKRISKAFYERVDWTGFYLGTNQTVEHPLRPFDPNLDGVRDVADLIYVHAMPEEQ